MRSLKAVGLRRPRAGVAAPAADRFLRLWPFAGYVAAIKASQLGLKVRPIFADPRSAQHFPRAVCGARTERSRAAVVPAGCMRGDAWHPRWDLPERRLHPVQGAAGELAPLPPGAARLRGA